MLVENCLQMYWERTNACRKLLTIVLDAYKNAGKMQPKYFGKTIKFSVQNSTEK